MFQNVSPNHNKVEVQDSRRYEFSWGLSVILSFLCIHEFYGNNLGI